MRVRKGMKRYVRLFGKAIVKVREHARVSREELAQRSGISIHRLVRIENGTAARDLGVIELCRIAASINSTPSELAHRVAEYEAAQRSR